MPILLKVVAYTILPIVIAGLGIYVSLRRNMPDYERWACVWFFIGLLIIAMGLSYLVESKSAAIEDGKDAARDQLSRTQAAELEVLRVQSVQQYQELLARIPVPVANIARLPETDHRLAEDTIAWATRMRNFEAQYESQRPQWTAASGFNNLSEDEKHRLFRDHTTALINQSNDERRRFGNEYLGRAVQLKNELERRLHQAPSDEGHRLTAFDGFLAGVYPISNAANYLEQLARRLDPHV